MLGTDKIDSIVDSLKTLIISGKKISKDGVNYDDIPAVIELATKAPQIIQSFKDLGEAFEQGKDIDVAEFIGLVQKINAAVKEIEKA